MFNPIWGFDFKVTIDNHVVILFPGKQIDIPVKLGLLRGNPQQVSLDVSTRWESVGLTTGIRFSKLTPSQPWLAIMTIKASPDTPPGSYLFTVRGSVKGTFHTSEDAITVIIKPKDEQESEKDDSSQSVNSNSSFDLDKLFAPKGAGIITNNNPSSSHPVKTMKAAKDSNWTLVIIGLTIGGIIIAAIMGGGGGFGTTRRCIGSSLSDAPECSDCNPVYEKTTFNGRNVGNCIAHPGTGRYSDQCDITCK